MNANREQWLDITKGFAILLVVVGHILIGFLTADMFPEMKDGIRYVVCTLYSFHMPLFFALSGYLYARFEKRPVRQEYPAFALKKLIRLGIPFVIFSWLQGLMRLAMNGSTNHPFRPEQLLHILDTPYDQFWFLYALLAIFLVVSLLETLIRNDFLIFGILLILKLIPAVFNVAIPLPFFEWLMAYALYFYAGAIVARHGQTVITNPVILTAGAALYIGFNVFYFSHNPLNWRLGNPPTLWKSVSSIGLAFSGILFALFLVQRVLKPIPGLRGLLNLLGLYSFEIYLLHIIPSAAMRIILVKFFHNNDFTLHLTLAILIGVTLPMLAGWLASKNKSLGFLFYPGKYIKLNKLKSQPASSSTAS